MRAAHFLLNVLAALVIAGCFVSWLYVCRSVVSCAPAPKMVLASALGAPVAAHFLCSVAALLALGRQWRASWSLLGLMAGTIALFTSAVAFAYAVLFGIQIENAVPLLLYGALAIIALVPVATAVNVIVLFSALRGALLKAR